MHHDKIMAFVFLSTAFSSVLFAWIISGAYLNEALSSDQMTRPSAVRVVSVRHHLFYFALGLTAGVCLRLNIVC